MTSASILKQPWAGGMLLCALPSREFDGSQGDKFTVDIGRWKQLKQMKREHWSQHRALLQPSVSRDRSLASMALFDGNLDNISIANLVAWHGAIVLNQEPIHPLGVQFPSVSEALIRAAIWADATNGTPNEITRSALAQVYSLARAADRPLTNLLQDHDQTIDTFRCVVARDQAVRNPDFTPEQETGAVILIMQHQFLMGDLTFSANLGPHLEPLRPFLERWRIPEYGYAECLDLLVRHIPSPCAIVLADHAFALRQMNLNELPVWKGPRLQRIDLDAAKAPVPPGSDAELPPEYAP